MSSFFSLKRRSESTSATQPSASSSAPFHHAGSRSSLPLLRTKKSLSQLISHPTPVPAPTAFQHEHYEQPHSGGGRGEGGSSIPRRPQRPTAVDLQYQQQQYRQQELPPPPPLPAAAYRDRAAHSLIPPATSVLSPTFRPPSREHLQQASPGRDNIRRFVSKVFCSPTNKVDYNLQHSPIVAAAGYDDDDDVSLSRFSSTIMKKLC
jgi:hypothetical protein